MTDNNYPDFNQSDDSIDIKRIIIKIIQNWYWFIITIFIGIIGAHYVTIYSTPQFQENASILVDNNQNNSTSNITDVIQEMGAFRKFKKKIIVTEMGRLSSFSLAYKTIRSLDDFNIYYITLGRIRNVERYNTTPFKVILNNDTTQLWNSTLHVIVLDSSHYKIDIDGDDIYETHRFHERLYQPNSYDFTIIQRPGIKYSKNILISESTIFTVIIKDYLSLAAFYQKNLSLEQYEEKSSIINLSINKEVPQRAADYLNQLMRTYIKLQLDKKNNITINTINFIDTQLVHIADTLNNIANRLQQYRSLHKITDISQQGNLIYSKLERLTAQNIQLIVKKEYYNYLLQYLESNDNDENLDKMTSPSLAGVSDITLNNLVSTLIDNYNAYQSLKYSSKKDNPNIKLARHNLIESKKAIIENIKNLQASNNLEIAQMQEQIKLVNKELEKLPYTEKDLINIQRKYQLSNDLYTFLLRKKSEAGIVKASNVAESEILDEAIAQNAIQTAPKSSLNTIIGFILGILLPLIIIILRDYFNTKITDKKDIENNTKLPIVGIIGHSPSATDIIVHKKPKASISEAFRSIRTNIKFFETHKEEKNATVIAINSTISGEGKTFMAANLSAIIAMSNKKTIILGLDLRKPKIHKAFNLDNSTGLSNYLSDTSISLNDIIRETDIKNLHIITSGTIPPNPAELIESSRLDTLMENLHQHYDYIIFDTPPLALVTDALLLNKYTDANLFVIRHNYSPKDVMPFINQLADNKKLTSISIIVNDLKVNAHYGYKSAYRYSYSYGYNYGYGYGYGNYGQGYYSDDNEKEHKSSFLSRLFKK